MLRVDRSRLALAIVAAIYVAAALLVRSPLWSINADVLAAGIVFDLTATSIVILWLVGGYDHTKILRVSIIVSALGLSFADLVFPPNAVTASPLFFTAKIILRLGIVAIAVHDLRRVIRRRHALIVAGVPTEESLVRAMQDILPIKRAAPYIATELEVAGLLLTGWRSSPPTGPHVFTMYKESGWFGLVGGFGFLVICETFVLHLLVAEWNLLVAWALTATSLYTLVWLVAEIQAHRLRPTTVNQDSIDVRVGIRWRLKIDRANIRSIERASGDGAAGHVNLCQPMYETVRLQLIEPVNAHGPIGLRRRVQSVGLAIDEADRFVEQVRPRDK